jgi:hypothetical protein
MPAWALTVILFALGLLIAGVTKLAMDVAGVKGMRDGLCKTHTDALVGLLADSKTTTTVLNRLVWRAEQYDKVLAPQLASEVHSPDHVMRDMLVEQYVEGKLKPKSVPKLLRLLQQMIDEDATTGRKLAAAMLLKDQVERQSGGA